LLLLYLSVKGEVMKRQLLGALVAAVVMAGTGLTASPGQAAAVHPAKPAKNYYYGSDGATEAQCGTSAPHTMADDFATSKATDNDNAVASKADCKKTDGSYAGYIGSIGNWDNHEGCAHADGVPFTRGASAAAANADGGVGANGYWMLGGPGRAPRYDSTNDASDADAWGTQQAKWALASPWMKYLNENPRQAYLFVDIEYGVSGWDNGWFTIWKGGGCSTRSEAKSTEKYNWDTLKAFWTYWYSQYDLGRTHVKLGVYNDFLGGDNGLGGIFPYNKLSSNVLEWTWDYQEQANDAYPTSFSSSPGTSWGTTAACEGAWQFSTGPYAIRLDLFNYKAFESDGCSRSGAV
jgi:hypothetical protein